MARYNGVGENELKWFKDYLDGRRQKFCVEDAKSEWATIIERNTTVLRALEPLNAYDLPQAVQNGSVQQYGDHKTMSLVG